MTTNPLKMKGISFVEFSDADPKRIRNLLYGFGFSLTHRGKTDGVEMYNQNEINAILNIRDPSEGFRFSVAHGPTISAMGWAFENPADAHAKALARGAKDGSCDDYLDPSGRRIPAIFGIGGTRIYFVQHQTLSGLVQEIDFKPAPFPQKKNPCGFLKIDHLTNNVPNGTMAQWRSFYKEVFGFEDVRTFDIKGKKTGLQSYALRSPDGSFCIPINEAKEEKSQINEYLVRHNGAGIQHLAFLTDNLISSLDRLKGSGIEMLDIDPNYYKAAFARVPGVKEDKTQIQNHHILVDGDDDGYLLQIFTKDLIGPIFIELIQRQNHLSFGEGNFQALFDSIERDQEKRGVL